MREAQRSFRRRKEDLLQNQSQRIKLLEKALEDISNSFLDLGSTVLEASKAGSSSDVVAVVREKTRQVLESTKKIQALDPIGDATDNNPSAQQDEEPEYASEDTLTNSSPRDLPSDGQSALNEYLEAPVTYVPMDDLNYDMYSTALSQTSAPALPLPGMFFSKEFWTGDYVNYDAVLPGEIIPDGLSLSQRLARLTLIQGYHNLRGDIGYSADIAKLQYRYGLVFRNVGFILARTRDILVKMEDAQVYSGPVVPPVPDYFEDDYANPWSHEVMSLMRAKGDYPEDYVDADQVETYLKIKGLYYDDGKTLRMALEIPRRSGNLKVVQKQHVELDVADFVKRLIDAAICLGKGVGYPKEIMNSVIVKSVKRVLT